LLRKDLHVSESKSYVLLPIETYVMADCNQFINIELNLFFFIVLP
jgi:hypothetical protein